MRDPPYGLVARPVSIVDWEIIPSSISLDVSFSNLFHSANAGASKSRGLVIPASCRTSKEPVSETKYFNSRCKK